MIGSNIWNLVIVWRILPSVTQMVIINVIYTAVYSLVMLILGKLNLVQRIVHWNWGLWGKKRESLIYISLLLIETTNGCVVLRGMLSWWVHKRAYLVTVTHAFPVTAISRGAALTLWPFWLLRPYHQLSLIVESHLWMIINARVIMMMKSWHFGETIKNILMRFIIYAYRGYYYWDNSCYCWSIYWNYWTYWRLSFMLTGYFWLMCKFSTT
jgi:hypothetical protein